MQNMKNLWEIADILGIESRRPAKKENFFKGVLMGIGIYAIGSFLRNTLSRFLKTHQSK